MKRPVLVHLRRTGCQPVPKKSHSGTGYQPVLRTGYTLVEILVATTLALLLMTAVTAMLGRVGESITDSRSMLEAADRLRLAETRLQMDLAGITATVSPPLKPENNEGYFEYIEGPAFAGMSPTIAKNSDNGNADDPTVGDFDDILMFTTRTTGKPFVGRVPPSIVINGNTEATNGTIQSDVAEVMWFLRGRTLHRRVLLVVPNVTLPTASANYYANYDISARWDTTNNRLLPNSLGDLTRRECRFAHWWAAAAPTYDVRNWNWYLTSNTSRRFPTLPTLTECSSTGWIVGQAPTAISFDTLDLWTNATGYRLADNAYAAGGTPVSDDIILTNVIGFDVKAWDPVQGAYVNLGVNSSSPVNGLDHPGQPLSQLAGSANIARIYDTWSTTNYNPLWNNGIDDDADGIVDDDDEKGVPPPYPIPLRGIQVKIRVFEPDSMQIREVTVEQDFLPR